MNVEAVVITSYPGHFYLTASTIKSFLKHNPARPIVVIADDLSEWTWPNYIQDCKQLYQCEVLLASQVLGIKVLAHAPWYRQQLVKLHLDQLVPYESWLSVDGDIVFQEPLTVAATFYTPSPGGPLQQKQNRYVKKVLGIESVGIWAYGQQMCVSNPPIKFLNRQVLHQLRNHVMQLHQRSILDLHLNLMGEDYSVTEWELIENFKTHVLNQNLHLVRYHTNLIGNNLDHRPKHRCLTCYATDAQIGRTWFEQQGIMVQDSIWQQLLRITR